MPIDHPGNVIVVSVPSPSTLLRPDGHHVIHAYTVNEPFLWERFEKQDPNEYRKDPEYIQLKEERAAPM